MKLELFNADSLNIVEFNITGDNDSYIRCDDESRYMNTEVFNLFIDCFEASNKLYDYFEPTKYNARTIVPLLNALMEKEKEWEAIRDVESFESYLQTLFLGNDLLSRLKSKDAFFNDNWNNYLVKFKKITKDLISLIHECIEEDYILWVIGY